MSYENNAFNLQSGTSVNHYGPRTIDDVGGETKNYGRVHEVRQRITLADLDSAFVGVLQETSIPAGAIIEDITVNVLEAATSTGAAVLDVGLYYDSSGTVTALDADGLVDAEVITNKLDGATGRQLGITGGTVVAFTNDPVLHNTELAATATSYYIGASYATEVFTAGEVEVNVKWSMPSDAGV